MWSQIGYKTTTSFPEAMQTDPFYRITHIFDNWTKYDDYTAYDNKQL